MSWRFWIFAPILKIQDLHHFFMIGEDVMKILYVGWGHPSSLQFSQCLKEARVWPLARSALHAVVIPTSSQLKSPGAPSWRLFTSMPTQHHYSASMVSNSSSFPFDLKIHATDYLPDALATDTLRGLVHQQDEQLSYLNDEIALLRVCLHALEEQRAELAKFRDLHRALLAPIRKLAPEILAEVFIQCAMDVWNGPLPNGWHACTFDDRLSLLRVCQWWKPGFWMVLRFDATSQKPGECEEFSQSSPNLLMDSLLLIYINSTWPLDSIKHNSCNRLLGME